MSWFRNLRLAPKLLTSFAAVLSLTLGLGLFATMQMRKVNREVVVLSTGWLPSVQLSGAMNTATSDIRISQLKHVLATTPAELTAAERDIADRTATLVQLEQEYEKVISSETERQLLEEFRRQWTEYEKVWNAVAPMSRAVVDANTPADERALADSLTRDRLNKEGRVAFEAANVSLTDLSELNRKGADSSSDIVARSYAAGSRLISLTMAVALLLGFGVAILVARIISAPVRRMAAVAEALAEGDVNQRVAVESRDEIGDLGRSFERMLEGQRALATAADAAAAGDLSRSVTLRGERDVVGQAFQKLQGTMHALVEETDGLTRAAESGKLQRRADATRFDGAFRQLVQGMNGTLDAVLQPIGEAAEVLERVADRDLTARVIGDYQGDHAKIKIALNSAVTNLADTLTQVRAAAEQVSSAGGQITAGSQSLAEGASEQASSLEEVSSSLQEMAAMTRQSSGNAREAHSIANEARNAAEEGQQRMTHLTEAVTRIKQSTDATAKILKAIDEIAFQTNLLALNAAVEAARAGDAGRGFAVVADEVRALALRSAEAARSTAALIEEVVRSAEEGVTINAHVGQQLATIFTQAERVGAVTAEIAAGNEQQATGVDQLNIAVEQMNGVTQQVAANAEEAASAAEELDGQARTMGELVGRFNLGVAAASGHRAKASNARQQLRPKPAAVRGSGAPGRIPAAAFAPLDANSLDDGWAIDDAPEPHGSRRG